MAVSSCRPAWLTPQIIGLLAAFALVQTSNPLFAQRELPRSPLADHLAGSSLESCPQLQLIPIDVKEGRCEFVVPTPIPQDKYLLIIGSLAPQVRSWPVYITTSGTPVAAKWALARDGFATASAGRIADFHRRQDQARHGRALLPDYEPTRDPPRSRVFYLLQKPSDLQDPRNYRAIEADLVTIGRHCQVYSQHNLATTDRVKSLAAEACRIFDGEVFPDIRKRLGHSLDVDRDGRFTLLFTDRLTQLGDSRAPLDGFVRGCDFEREIAPPFGNQCDMMYLSDQIKPGAPLHSLLAHEYTHAVVYSEHVFGRYLGEIPGDDEEAWLNEGIAHLSEDHPGAQWTNLDYRVSAFLADTGRYELVAPDYFKAGLFRSPGHRGATYLFLRWCSDQMGPDFAGQLTRSSLPGLMNLETASQTPFPLLFRQWSAALALGGSGLEAVHARPLCRHNLCQPLGGRFLAGQRQQHLGLDGQELELNCHGTASIAVILHSPARQCSRVTLRAAPEAQLQVSLIRLPATLGRLTGTWDKNAKRLQLTALDADCTLTQAVWERFPPHANRPGDTSFRTPASARDAVSAWFPIAQIKAGQTLASRPLTIPSFDADAENLIFKILAKDSSGHTLSTYVAVAR